MMNTKSVTIWVMSAEYMPLIIGGLGTVASELSTALARNHLRVKVVTRSPNPFIQLSKRLNTSVLHIPDNHANYNWNSNQYKPIRTAKLAISRLSGIPDVIHLHSLEYTDLALWMKKKYRLSVLYTCHSLVSMERMKGQKLLKTQIKLLRGADRVVVPSFWLKSEIQRRYKISSGKIRVIPNGVTPASFQSNAPRYKLLYVGRLMHEKGIEPLIRSISILSKVDRRVSLTIIGRGAQKYRSALQLTAKRQGLIKRIHWLGFIPHHKVRHLYASYGAVVNPSTIESFGLVALEAMANGVPLVSTRAGGLKEFVHPSNAQIIKSAKSTAISQAVKAMWKQPSLTRRRVIRAKAVAKQYHWSRIAKRYKSLMMQMCGKSKLLITRRHI
jgi:glycogen(starch) synthase